MKRWLSVFLALFFLTGCSRDDAHLRRAMDLRNTLLSSGCSFEAQITADYGAQTHTFSMQCLADVSGKLSFTVTQPQIIHGITGTLSASGGQLTFDDVAVSFEMLSDGELSPVSSVWILVNTLRSGYIRSCGTDGDSLRLTVDDSYEEDALQLDIWLDREDHPRYAEILWQGRRILSIEVSNFLFV